MHLSRFALILAGLAWHPSAAQSTTAPAEEADHVPSSRLVRPTEAENIVRVVPLEHLRPDDANRAVSRVSSRFAWGGRLLSATSDYTANSVILAGSQEAIDQAVALIKMLDVETADVRETRFIKLDAVQASEAVALLKSILEQIYPNRNRTELPGLLSYARTNALVVVSSERDYQLIKLLLKDIDTEVPSYSPPQQRSAARFEIAVYEATIPRESLGNLDATKLTEQAQTRRSLQNALEEQGKTRILYSAEDVFALSSNPKLSLQSNVPFIRGTQVTKSGQTTSQIEYEKIGCEVKLGGFWNDDQRNSGEATAEIAMSVIADSATQIGNGVAAPVFRQIAQPFGGEVISGQPIVLLTVDAAGDADTAAVYVTRMVFHHR